MYLLLWFLIFLEVLMISGLLPDPKVSKVSKVWGIFVDYQRLLIKSDVPDMDVISLGVTYHF